MRVKGKELARRVYCHCVKSETSAPAMSRGCVNLELIVRARFFILSRKSKKKAAPNGAAFAFMLLPAIGCL